MNGGRTVLPPIQAKEYLMDITAGERRPFAPGDVVRLRSGGPVMTVESTQGTQVNVVWFSGLELKRAHFQPPALARTDTASS